MRKFLMCLLLAAGTIYSAAWATTTTDTYRAALLFKKKGLWERALPLMQELANQGHIPAKTDLAIMLLPMRDHGEAHGLTRLSYTNEKVALALLDEAVASGYGRAMITSADWHTDHAAFRCQAQECRIQHLLQAKQLHKTAAEMGEHQSHAWLAYYYRQFCDVAGTNLKARDHRKLAIDIYRLKRPRASEHLANHWFKTYGVFTGHLQRISLPDPDTICQ